MKLKTKVFNASQFTATEFDTAADKAEFANHFIQFIERDYPESLFNKKFYKRLSMTFGHIAHYNQGGFYETFFDTDEHKHDFMYQTMNHGCYGDPHYTYSDVERAVQKYLRERRGVSRFDQQDLT